MTPSALAKQLFMTYERYRVEHLNPRNCKHAVLFEALFETVLHSGKLLSMEEVGSSLEGRTINMIKCGRGYRRVLLWSQMHGDETTATLALIDMFNMLSATGGSEPWMERMLEETTLFFVPMLNPDGAERVDRRTAAGIDMNRDALVLATPEAKILRDLQHRLKPAFGFNLHDQELSSAGNSRQSTAIALLAPAADEKKTKPTVRVRAMRVAAFIARILDPFAHGHLAGYDDTFEPRAFGDNMQRWGTSTVLIESGHWPNDPEKKIIRKLNYVGVLTALHGIATGAYQDVDLDYYLQLPANAKRVYDIIIRGVHLKHSSGWSHPVDIGISIDPLLNKSAGTVIATIKDLGDLSTYGALHTVDGSSRSIKTGRLEINQSLPLATVFDTLQLPQP